MSFRINKRVVETLVNKFAYGYSSYLLSNVPHVLNK